MTNYRGVKIQQDENGYFFRGLFNEQGYFDTLAEARAVVDDEIQEEREMDPDWPANDTSSIDLMAHHGPWNS